MNSDLGAACYSIFSLCVHVLRLCPVLRPFIDLVILPHKLIFWEIIVIQFVCCSKKPIVCLSKNYLVLIMFDQAGHLSLSEMQYDRGEKIFICPSSEIHEYVTVSTV